MAHRVDERAAGIARIDRRVGLDEVLEAVDAELIASKRADDAERDRAAETEWIADCQYDIADLNRLRRGERDRRQVAALGFQHREVRLRIAAANARLQLTPVGKDDLDIVCAAEPDPAGKEFGRDDDA